MKKTIAAAACFFVSTLAVPGLADDKGWTSDGGVYFSGRGLVLNLRGTNQTAIGSDRWEFEIGRGGTAAIGYAFALPDYGTDVRIEIEGSYREAANDAISFADGTFWDITGNTTIKAGMVNLLLDFHTQTRLSPYIGAGLGRAQIGFDDWLVVETDPLGAVSTFVLPPEEIDVAVWQAMAGFGLAISPGLIVDLEYRYFQPTSSNYNGLLSNELALGLRIVF
jgi:opacity protein-like surface antigen